MESGLGSLQSDRHHIGMYTYTCVSVGGVLYLHSSNVYKLCASMQLKWLHHVPSPSSALTHVVGDMSLTDSTLDPPPAYGEAVAASPKPPPQKAMKPFEVGMRLEAVDRKFPYFVCAAHIEEVKLQEGDV